MGTITVRNLDDGVQQRLRQRAAANNRSMEAEARDILAAAVADDGALLHSWLELAAAHRGEPLPLPERTRPRNLDLL